MMASQVSGIRYPQCPADSGGGGGGGGGGGEEEEQEGANCRQCVKCLNIQWRECLFG